MTKRDIVLGAVQGASALFPVLHTSDTPRKGLQVSQDVDLADVYREGDLEGGLGVNNREKERAAGHSAPETGAVVLGANRDAVCAAGGGEDNWESAGDRMDGCIRGGFSLTSLDISSPLVTSDFVKTCVLVHRAARCACSRPWFVLTYSRERPWLKSIGMASLRLSTR